MFLGACNRHYRFVVELETVNHTFGINSLSIDWWIERVYNETQGEGPLIVRFVEL